MIDAKSSTSSQMTAGLINPRGEDENILQLLTSTVNDLAAILYPKNYVFSVLGRHPKQTAKFAAAVYTMGGKAGARALDIGPESGESKVEVLNKLLWKIEVEVGKMMIKDSQSGGK